MSKVSEALEAHEEAIIRCVIASSDDISFWVDEDRDAALFPYRAKVTATRKALLRAVEELK